MFRANFTCSHHINRIIILTLFAHNDIKSLYLSYQKDICWSVILKYLFCHTKSVNIYTMVKENSLTPPSLFIN